MEWVNYHHLFYFRSIALEGSISKASLKLRLGQPTLSTQLKAFENALGVALFERRNRSLVLTEAGKIALDYANEIFRLGDEMRDALHDRFSSARITVQIGALDGVPKAILSQLVQVARKREDCSVSLLEGKGDELFRELNAHRLDLIVSNYPPPVGEQSGIVSKCVARLPVVVCGAQRFQEAKRNFPQSLHARPFVLPTLHSKLRHDLDHFFKLNKIAVESVAETQDTSVQKLLGVSGLGLLPLAEIAVEEEIQEKKLFKMGTLPGVFEEIWLISGARKMENPVAAQLMKSFSV